MVLQAPEGVSVVIGPAELVDDPQTTAFVVRRQAAASAVERAVPVATVVVPVPVVTVSVAVVVAGGSDGGYGA